MAYVHVYSYTVKRPLISGIVMSFRALFLLAAEDE